MSTKELLDILEGKNNRTDDFVLAVLWELDKRKKLSDQHIEVYNKLKSKQQRTQKVTEYESHYIPPDLPLSIRIVAYLLYSVLVVELIGTFIMGRTSFVGFSSLILPGSFITAFLGFFIHRGKIWAGYLFFVVYIFSTMLFIILGTFFDIISMIQQVIMTVALIFLFKQESRNWFRRNTNH